MIQHNNTPEFDNTVIEETSRPQQGTTGEVATVLSSESDESDAYNMTQLIIQLNPNGEFKFGGATRALYSSVKPEDLVLPNGFYLKNGYCITNKGNTKTGVYGVLPVRPIEDYNSDFEESD